MKSIFKILTLFVFVSNIYAAPTDYLVLSWDKENGLSSEFHKVVDLPNAQFVSKQASPNSIKLIGKDGGIGFVPVNSIEIKKSLAPHNFASHAKQNDETLYFVIRAKQGWIDKIVLPAQLAKNEIKTRQLSERSQVSHSSNLGEYHWSSLINEAKNKGLEKEIKRIKRYSPKTSQSMQQQKMPDNRVNLLFIAEGYKAEQEEAFNQYATRVIAVLEDTSPYKEYKSFFQYDLMFLESNESGADKPKACFDEEVMVDTVLDATYCTNQISRLLTVNRSKVLAFAADNPDWDQIVVLVNDSGHGGSGGLFSTISATDSSIPIFTHEYAHSFTGLADEYVNAYSGFPECSDAESSTTPCEANVTDTTTRSDVKWSHWIKPSTPVPTDPYSDAKDEIGLFEGARYQQSGYYRPRLTCAMRTVGEHFCEVCKEAYVFKLYDVEYGNNQNGDSKKLSLIEPGLTSPTSPTVTMSASDSLNFQIDTVQPEHALSVSWYVDDQLVKQIDSNEIRQTFAFIPKQSGKSTIKVLVQDKSRLVHPSRAHELPTFEQKWAVNIEEGDSNQGSKFRDGFELK